MWELPIIIGKRCQQLFCDYKIVFFNSANIKTMQFILFFAYSDMNEQIIMILCWVGFLSSSRFIHTCLKGYT